MPERRGVRPWTVVLAACAFGLLLAEGICRFRLPPDFRIGFYVKRFSEDVPRFRDGRPLSRVNYGVAYRFDADGFRLGGPGGWSGRTVLFLGDSLTLGFMVRGEETLVAAAQRRLSGRGLRAQCLNAGEAGLGAAAELRLLRRYLTRRRIDAVVVQLYPANDLTDNWQDGGFVLEEGGLAEKVPPLTPPLMRLRDLLLDNWLTRHSKLLLLTADTFCTGVTFLPRVDEDMLELERRLLLETARVLREKRIPLLLVLIPSPGEAGVRPIDRKPIHPNEGDPLVYGRVADMAEGLGAPVLDLRAVLTRQEQYRGTHLSPEGNEAAGRAIADRLLPLLSGSRVSAGGRGS